MVEHSPTILWNLLRDTSPATLVYLAEQYGMRRVPGLAHRDLINRLVNNLPPADLQRLQDDLIAARYGALDVDQLLDMMLSDEAYESVPAGKPRLDLISPAQAQLIEGGREAWVYTMRGHDVIVDMVHRRLSCDCRYYEFASRRRVLCKHLATALQLMPGVYAREALIEMLLTRQYGTSFTERWEFEPIVQSER